MPNEFTAVFERDGEWYMAYSPEIPEAKGKGRTKDEARQSLSGAIALIPTDRREDGLRGVPSTFDDAHGRARRAAVLVSAVLIRAMERPPEERIPNRPRRSFSELALDTGGAYYLLDNALDDMNSNATLVAEELHS